MSIPIIKGLDSLLTLEIQRLDNTGNSEKNDFTKVINEASQSITPAGGELEEPKIISPGTEWIEYSLLDEDLPDIIVGKDGAIDRITLFDDRLTDEILDFGTLILTSGNIEAFDRNSEEGRAEITTVGINDGIFSNNASGYIMFPNPTGEAKIVEFQNFDKTDLITFGSDTIKLANLSKLQNIESPDAVYLEGGIAEITPSGPYQHYYNGDLILDASKASDLMSSESGHLVITSGGISNSRLVTEEEMVFTVREFEPDTTGYIEFPQRSLDGNPAIVTFDNIGTLKEKWDTTFRLSISDLSQIEDKTIEELIDRIQSFSTVEIDPTIPSPIPQNIIETGTQYVRRLVSTPYESVTKEEKLLLDFNTLLDTDIVSREGKISIYLDGKDRNKVVIRDNQVFLKSGVDLEDFSKLDFEVKAAITNDFLGMPLLPVVELDSISVSISVLPPFIFRVLQSVVAASPDEYLEKYPDVAEAVKNGTMPSAVFHYANFGFFEGRDLPLVLSETQYVRKLVETPGEALTGEERLLLDFELRDGFVPVLEGEDAEKVIIRDNQVFLRDDVDTSRFDNIEFEIVPVSEVFFLAGRPIGGGSGVSFDTITEFLGPLERPAISVSIDVVSQEIYESMVKEVEALPQAYLDLYPDVAEAVDIGTMPSALFHFINFGFYEGRSTGVFSTSDPDIIDFEIFS